MRKTAAILCVSSFLSITINAGAVEYAVSKDVPVDTYAITQEVKVKDVKKIGMVYSGGKYTHWSSSIYRNLWNKFGVFEPRILSNWGMVEQGGENSFVCDTGWGLDGWGAFKSGYWDGAEVHVFGMKDGMFDLKRKSKMVKSVSGDKEVVDTYTLEDDGGAPLVAGDWFWLTKTLLKPNPNQKTIHQLTGKEFKKHGVNHFAGPANLIGNPSWELVLDPCPEAGSTASMKLTTSGSGGYYAHHTMQNNEKGWNQWPEGEFHWEAWLKRSTPGTVSVEIATQRKSFSVGTKWEKYEFDFNPAALLKDNSRPQRHTIRVSDACELYLDNVMVYHKDYEPFEMYPKYRDKIAEFKPGILRPYCGIITRNMDVGLSKGIAQAQEQDTTRGKWESRIQSSSYVTCFELAKEANSNPWIVTPGMMRLEDCDHLMEFLGAPENTGYGKRRASYGQKTPWIDEFDVVYIELGNEQWGANFSHCFNRKPEAYGRIADMYIRRMKSSPYYNPDKFKFICNGWGNVAKRGQWSEIASKSCPSADILDVAFYFGGWDGVSIKGDDANSLYQSRMLGAVHIVEKNLLQLLCVNPNAGEELAGILVGKKELQEAVFDTFTETRASQPFSSDILEIIRMIMETPATDLAGSLVINSKEAQQVLMNLFGINEEELADFQIGTLLRHDPKPSAEFTKKHPEIMRTFATKANLEDVAKTAINDVANGKNPARPWAICNAIMPPIRSGLISALAENEELAADLDREIDRVDMLGLEQKIIRQLFWGMGRLIETEAQPVMEKIKFGAIRMTDVATNKNIFKTDAQRIAQKVSVELKQQIAAYRSRSLDLNQFDDSSRQKILNKLLRTFESDQLSLAKDSLVLLAETTKAFASKDSSGLDSLPENAVFVEGLRKRMVDQFADAVIKAMEGDARIAEQIIFEYDQLPKNPEAGFKSHANYEAGPGYQLPGPGKKPAEEEEEFGKSLALGITTLDSFLYEMERNYGYLCYYKFGVGTYWATHNDSHSWRRNPSYETLLMVNQHTDGDMMFVDESNVGRFNIPKVEVTSINNRGKPVTRMVDGRKNISWTKCYAFKDGKKHSFVLYNRNFSENKTVRLDLPYSPRSKAILHKLSADSPMDTNRKELKVKQTKKTVDDFASGYTLELEPGSLVIIVNEEE